MNAYQRQLVDQFVAHQGKPSCHFDLHKYLGTQDHLYNVSAPVGRAIASAFIKQHPDISDTELFALLDALAQGKSNEEKTFLSMLLKRKKEWRQQVTPAHLDRWLNTLSGWCQVDSLCQNTLEPADFLAGWELWEKQLCTWAKDQNINKRRASLVLLCNPVGLGADPRFVQLALTNIETLKSEKDVLITKAISWLLRAFSRHYPAEVKTYLDAQASTLPAIAVRETRAKLATGKK